MSIVTERSGREKAAILLIALGAEKSAQVFKHLTEDEIEQLTIEIANTQSITSEARDAVMNEFYRDCVAQQYITEGGAAYAKQMLECTMGEERAEEMVGKLSASPKARPFDFVRKTEASQILNFIRNEHPQIIALVLAYLRPQQAAQVIKDLPPAKQVDVARRIATMDKMSSDVIKEVEQALEKKLSNLMLEDYTEVGGVNAVAEILKAMDGATEKSIMEMLASGNAELSEEIKRKMFVFEDIAQMDGHAIQEVLRQDIDHRELAIALKGASAGVQDVVFANMPKRMAEMIREEMKFLGPVRAAEADEIRQRMIGIIRRMQDSGEILIARVGGDEGIV